MTKWFLIALFLAVTATVAHAEEPLELRFDPPTERVDGTALDPETEVEHYTVYCATYPDGEYPDTGYQIPGLTETGEYETTFEALLGAHGRYRCAMTATDTDERESELSEEVTVFWLAAPGRPTNVIIVR